MDYFEGTRRARRRDAALAAVLVIAALFVFFLPGAYQAPVRQAVRGTALRPFLALQAEIAQRRVLAVDVAELRAQRDSLAAVAAAQAALAEENERLRALLGLRARAEPSFKAAQVLRLGVPGAESSFMLDIGAADGVRVGSPVLAAGGLLGMVVEVDEHMAQAIDWSHPDFRASAMTLDGTAYGLLEPRRGAFREADLMALTGAPFHSDIASGTRVVTSGRGGMYPRGIPLGVVVGIEEADTGWRKSYLVRPAVRPEAVLHVLVGVRKDSGGKGDLSQLWHVAAPPDTMDSAADTARPTSRETP
ncbi:MAG TPA: rod shape-determining protein MreC [Longimicrobiales bacterium]